MAQPPPYYAPVAPLHYYFPPPPAPLGAPPQLHYVTYYPPPVYTSPTSSISTDQPIYFGATQGPLERRKPKQSSTWSPKEDKLLRELKDVQKLGWREILTFFNDRTPNACQFRWRRIILGTTASGVAAEASSAKLRGAINRKSHHSINFLLN